MLPKQSTGLFRRTGTTRFYRLLVGENSCFPPHPFSAFWTFDCAPARRVAVLSHGVSALRAEVSPDGDKGSALDLQGGLVPLDSRLRVAVNGTLAAKL